MHSRGNIGLQSPNSPEFVNIEEDAAAFELEVSHHVGQRLRKQQLHVEELVSAQVPVLLVHVHVLQEVRQEVGETERRTRLWTELLLYSVRHVAWNRSFCATLYRRKKCGYKMLCHFGKSKWKTYPR